MASLRELRERCRTLGLSSGGNKMQLIRRLNAHQVATTVESSLECECEAIIAKPIKLQGDDEMISETRLVLQNASQQDRLQSENFRGNVFVGNEGGLRYAEKRV
jgi:SAP domain